MAKRKSQKNNKRSNNGKRNSTNTLRIIGGEWRSRKLPFIDAQGLRPTPDRIRETLFNWLQGHIHGANCLDLFAGSGVLGLEALSRGAAQVIFVEKNKVVANQLKENLALLKADAEVHQIDALEYLSSPSNIMQKWGEGLRQGSAELLDIVFLDPPYRQDLLEKVLKIICDQERGFIGENTLIYLEHEAEESFDWEVFGLKILKQTDAGQVKSYLLQKIS